MRMALGVEYDGSSYAGWQRQHHAITIQAMVEQALSKVANHPVMTICAGRTDAGVHARGQVLHFDSNSSRSERAWVCGTNNDLPPDIIIRWALPVPDHFHARYSAIMRTYQYIILNQGIRSALYRQHATCIFRPLDVAAMAEAGQWLIGEHDFAAFRASSCQSKSSHRNLVQLKVTGSIPWIALEITANAFLHHMVRNIVGVLIAIGAGQQPVTWTRELLEGKDRRRAGITAPATGLYLQAVAYPLEYGLPVPLAAQMIPPEISY